MNTTLTYLTTNLHHYWPAIAAFVASGGAISLVTQVTKKVKQWEKDSKIQRFVLLTSFIGTFADWYLQNYSTHFIHAVTPFVWLPAVTTALFTLATFLHKFPVKQIVAFVQQNLIGVWQDAEKYRAETHASAETPPVDTFQV